MAASYFGQHRSSNSYLYQRLREARGLNYGDYAYTVNGVTWDLQDLVWLPYFGAPASTSANGYSTFQGESIAFCSAGG